MIEPPIDEGESRDLAIVKVVLGLVPHVGGALAEFVGLTQNTLAKRQEAWMVEISNAVNELHNRAGISVQDLMHNDAFVSFLLRSTDIALRNHQREKFVALRCALVSVAMPEQSSDDLAFQFLRYIEELTVTHLAILEAISLHHVVFGQIKTMQAVYEELNRNNVLTQDKHVFRSFLNDLNARGLLHSSDLQDYEEYESKAGYIALETSDRHSLTVTPLGHRFLQFISSSED